MKTTNDIRGIVCMLMCRLNR